jgi:subtilisin family serine protease
MKIKKQIFLAAMLVSIGLIISNGAGTGYLLEGNNEKVISVLVYLKDQVDLQAINNQMDEQIATLQERHETTVVSLQNTAYATQPKLVEYLNELKSQKIVKEFKCFWIRNIIRVDTYQSVVDQIAKRDDVLRVYPNYNIELIEPVALRSEDKEGNREGIEPGVEAVRAPEVWAMNITGEGVLVATIDTGVDGNHPALASRWAGVADPRYEGHPEWAWLDPYAGQNDFPYDNGGHGTHTMGTVCGGAPGDQIGVAPGALWISAAAIDRGGGIPQTVEDAITSLQWMIDPDGNPSTNWDVPAVCSNSWGVTTYHGYPPCDETFWTFLDACESAGIVIIFSAGNEGTQGLRRPADRATDDYRTFAVAAVDANDPEWPIADFSSRGPTFCTPNGTEAIKPDIAAPGVNVRSSWPGGGYYNLDGTSMASPHINGVVALMRQAAPNMSVQDIKQIIYETAHDLGDSGEDNDYGWGMVDAYEAVMNTSQPPETPTTPDGPDEWIQNIETTFSSTTTDPEGEDVYYKFDWGDGNFSGWVGPYASGETGEASYIWTEIGDYQVRAIAKDIHGAQSVWSEPHIISIDENQPPANPTIKGPSSGNGGKIYKFTFVSTDQEGQDIYYKVDWDDGSNTGWIGPYNSGEQITLNHSWNKKGEYLIKAWAKDIFECESGQGNFRIKILTNGKTLQKNQGYRNLLFFQILEKFIWRFPLLEKLLYL